MLKTFMPIRYASIVIALLVTSFCQASAAAEPSTKPVPRKLLSKAELRACVLRESTLNKEREALEQAQIDHVAAGAVLSAEAIALSKMLRAMDNSDEVAVDTYNRKNDERNQQVESHNKRAEALNAASIDLQARQADFLVECTSRPFLKEDEDAVRKELGVGKKPKPSEPKGPPGRPPIRGTA